MRQLGLAARLYADENSDVFPRSQHSAFANGELPWERAVAPQLGSDALAWTNLLKGVYHCSSDARTNGWSYGMNVYFELGPEDDYVGKPEIWRRATRVLKPCVTILFAEDATSADHIMAHFWTVPADATDVDARRHRQKANYAFVDGRARVFAFRFTYEPAGTIDLWNPSLAR